MQDTLLATLNSKRSGIHQRWSALLHGQKAATPLADPVVLVRLIDWGLTEIFTALRDPATAHRTGQRRRKLVLPKCPRGRNPLVGFFVAGEQALLETIVVEQAFHRPADPAQRDNALNELFFIVRTMATREIGSFCSFCGLCRQQAANAAAR